MKIIYYKKLKWLLGVITSFIVFVIVFINVAGYIFNCKYISTIAALSEVNKYEVRNELLMDAINEVGVCSPEDAVKVWADGLIKRNAALQFSVMGPELKKEYIKQLDKNFPNWVTGVSSPLVKDYQITNITDTNENEKNVSLKIFTETSAGPAENYNAVLTVAREGDFWRIINIAADKGLYPWVLIMSEKDYSKKREV